MAEVPAGHAPGKARGRGRTVLATIAFFVALAILLALGTWQVERLQWKEALLADMAARRTAAPVPLADIEAMAAKGEDIEYRPVTALPTAASSSSTAASCPTRRRSRKCASRASSRERRP